MNSLLQPAFGSYHAGYIDAFEDSLAAAHLVHYASRLLNKGLHDEAELEQALHKAVVACRSAGLPVFQNFRTVFVCSGDCIRADWLVSDLGLQLILLNADVSNPLVAKLQVQVLSSVYSEESL